MARPTGRSRRRRTSFPYAPRTGRKAALVLAGLAAVVLLGVIGYSWARAALLPHLVRVVEAQAGTLETVIRGPAAVLREEWVLTAPAAGAVRVLAREGERVRSGSPVCRVNDRDVVSPAPGVVSLVVDGTEGRLPVRPGASPPASEVLALKPRPSSLQDGQLVAVGQPLARVVDNREWRLCVSLPPAEVRELAGRSRLRVRLPALGEEEFVLPVEASRPGDDRTYGTITLWGREWRQELARIRVLEVEVVKEQFSGVIVPRRSLVKKEEQVGVFVVKKTLAQWVKVEVRGEKGSRVAVEGIPEGSQVIVNPWLVREGAIVR